MHSWEPGTCWWYPTSATKWQRGITARHWPQPEEAWQQGCAAQPASTAVVSREEGHRAKGKTKADYLSKSRPEVSEVFLSAKQTPACMCDSDSCCFLLQTCAGGAAFNILLSAGYRPNLERQQSGKNASGWCLLKWMRRDQPVKCSEG